MNVVTLVGRMANEPSISTTTNGKRKVESAIGVTKFKSGGEKETMWINFVAFEYTADKIAKYIHRGDMFTIVGHLDVSSYLDKNGEQRKAWKVIVDSVPDLLPNNRRENADIEQDTVENIVKKDMKNRIEDLDKWSTPVFEEAGDLPF